MVLLPPTRPLERLQVTDGLLLTADRWRVAHRYHRQRQDLHFQALYQPGIVHGLEVWPTVAPPQVSHQYQDGRWIQVQPGLAIDRQGNPIVVSRPVEYHIAAQPGPQPLQVYLVLSFVDPDQLEGQAGTHVVQETFRLEEKVSPPDSSEIELCRILLGPGNEALRSPRNSFAPVAQDLDLRQRPRVQRRPQGQLRLGYLAPVSGPVSGPAIATALQGIVDALPGLYPALQGHATIDPLPLDRPMAPATDPAAYDLLYVAYGDSQRLPQTSLAPLQTHLAQGGVLLLEVPATGTPLDDLLQIWSDVVKVLAASTPTVANQAKYAQLHTERAELERCMALELTQMIPSLASLVDVDTTTGATWAQLGTLSAQHPLQVHPFRFGMLPLIYDRPLALFNWGGVVVVVGDLISAWGGEQAYFLPRETIRSAQELGINLLHFAWQRRLWATDQRLPLAPPPILESI
ncbi:hypothetical protein [Nodosilinea sp. E11]|uniref:hypothetical protein n=1 Tax=Nodosilinea sp. E11 TaxID=3037479 RepID=UPI002934B331|nr:hypothetical protein [Nodosilinea sp. E11]WOD37093.1 hypothetical protein RRF56_01135 [Nodosilinea sp. E11]